MLQSSARSLCRVVPRRIQTLLDARPIPVRGFECGGVAAGIKGGSKPDVFLVKSSFPESTTAAGVFTLNKVRAAPVIVSEAVLGKSKPESMTNKNLFFNPGDSGPSAVFGNAGCANAVTGARGMRDAEEMAEMAGGAVVMSTGVIGQHLDMDKIRAGYTSAEASLDSGESGVIACAEAMMTTDIVRKTASRTSATPSDGSSFTVTGLAKGSGMIHPNMGTMLCTIMTDARVNNSDLNAIIKEAVDKSFNCITVDGDTSTNDAVVILANGASKENNEEGVASIPDLSEQDRAVVLDAVTGVAQDLATLVAFDGEGATKLITIKVTGAGSDSDARVLARSIGGSSLVKTAIFGEDANWGRILCAAGYSGVDFDPAKVTCSIAASSLPEADRSERLLESGEPLDINEDRTAKIVAEPEVEIMMDLGKEGGEAVVWASDLTHGYITINGSYRS